MKKVNYQKIVARGLFLIILILIFSFSVGLMSSVANAGKNVEFIQITVQEGDSLWKIVDTYDNNKMDLRKLIYQVEEINNIKGDIYPGQVLNIPIYK